MPPASLIALAIVTIAVIPGSMYTWAYEREASAFGVTLADRTLRFIAISLLFHLALGWPEYALYRVALAGPRFGVGQFAAVWGAIVLVVALPAVMGTVLGGLYATRNSREGLGSDPQSAKPRARAAALAPCSGPRPSTSGLG
jgi:Family of unknown function (DUF6338)